MTLKIRHSRLKMRCGRGYNMAKKFVDIFMDTYTRWQYNKYDTNIVPDIMKQTYINILRDEDFQYIQKNIKRYVDSIRAEINKSEEIVEETKEISQNDTD